jgi:hypothetical protein
MAARTDQKWSAALIRRMARLADQEMSTAQIAKALGLTRGHTWANARPGPRQNASTRPQDEERSQPQKRPAAESGTP